MESSSRGPGAFCFLVGNFTMPCAYKTISIALLMAVFCTTSPAAIARNPEAVEDLFSIARRVMDYFSYAKTFADAARALQTMIDDRATHECRDTPIPSMSELQCVRAVSHVVNQCIDVARQKCPDLFSRGDAAGRMTCDIDCLEIKQRLGKDIDIRCETGSAPPWFPCSE